MLITWSCSGIKKKAHHSSSASDFRERLTHWGNGCGQQAHVHNRLYWITNVAPPQSFQMTSRSSKFAQDLRGGWPPHTMRLRAKRVTRKKKMGSDKQWRKQGTVQCRLFICTMPKKVSHDSWLPSPRVLQGATCSHICLRITARPFFPGWAPE